MMEQLRRLGFADPAGRVSGPLLMGCSLEDPAFYGRPK
jgi:hypothetical protein